MTAPESGSSDNVLRQLESERSRRTGVTRREALIGIGSALLGTLGGWGVPRVINWGLGQSNDPLHRDLDWKVANLQTDEQTWHTFAADPHADALPGTWSTLGVLKVPANAYDTTRLALQQPTNDELAQAVAFQTGDTTHVGTLQVDGQFQNFLGMSYEADEADMIVGLRIGNGILSAALGYYRNETNTFIMAPQVAKASDQPVPIHRLGTQFPGAVWAA